MTTEELKVKLILDTSDFTPSANKARKELGGIGSATKAGTGQATASFVELKDSIEKVRNFQFADLIVSNLGKIKKHTKAITDSFGMAKEEFAEAARVFRENFPGSETWKDMRDDGMSVFDIIKVNTRDLGKDMKTLPIPGLKEMRKGFVALGKEAKAALTSIIGQVAILVGAIAAWVAGIRNAINVSKQMKQITAEATKVGLDVSTYQEWGYILESTGVEVDKLSDFMKTLAAEQNAVRDGSEDTIKAFERLGISAEEAAGATQGALFEKTIRGLQSLEDEVERTSLAYRIFGEDDAANLIPILKLNNAEMERLIENYYMLGGAASDSLIQKSSTLQGALHNLSTAWQGIKNTLAEGFMPVITAVVNWLTKTIAIINMFIRAVFGFETVTSGSTEGTESVSEGMSSIGGAAENAIKSVEKLKRTTMGFDELNVVTNPNSKDGSSAGSGGTGSGAGSLPDMSGIAALSEKFDLSGWKDKIDRWGGVIRAVVPAAMVGIGAVGAVLAAFSGHWILAIALAGMAGIGLMAMGSGEGGFQGYVDNFATTCNGMLVPAMVGAGAIGGVIALLTGNIPAAVALFALAGVGLALSTTDGFQGLLDGFAGKVLMIGSIAMAAVGIIGGIIALLCGAIPLGIGLLLMGGIGIAGITTGGFWDEIGAWLMKFFKSIGDFFAGVWEGIKSVFSAIGTWFKNVFTAAWNGIKSAWSAVVSFFAGVWAGITNIFNSVVNFFVNVFKAAWEGIKTAWNAVIEWFKNLWAGIKNVFNAVGNWFTNVFKAAWNGIKNAWSAVTNWFSNLWTGIKNVFSSVGTWFSNIFKGAWNGIKTAFSSVGSFFTGVWTTIKNIFTNIGSTIGNAVSGAFKSAINWVLDKAIGLINGFIGGINKAISIINKIPGVNIKEIGLLDVPQMAKGGIVTASTIANIGEAGKEAVLPLENNTGWMDKLADKVAARNNTPTKIVLQVGEKELGWATIGAINGITKQLGGLQLAL